MRKDTKSMFAKAAEAATKLGSKLTKLPTRASTMFARVKKSEVAEALIATWCIEFLRVRKVGGFNVVEIVVISALMLGVKTIVMEASKRKYSGKARSVVVSRGPAQMDPMALYKRSPRTRRGS
jgi:hypothetical protein